MSLGSITAEATWDIKDGTCLILRFGPLNDRQMETLAKYRTSSQTLDVVLPDYVEMAAEIIGFDKSDRSFYLSMHAPRGSQGLRGMGLF